MKPPTNTRPTLSSSDKTKILLVIIFLGILLLVFGVLLGLLLRRSGFQFSLAPVMQSQATLTISASVAPTMPIPTQDCGSPTLVLGTSIFQIQNITRGVDGSLAVPANTPGVAYWVEGTDKSMVFVVSPTPDDITAMSSNSVGSTAKVILSNCTSTTYSLSVPEAGSINSLTFTDQTMDTITIFFPMVSPSEGFIYKGELEQQQISSINTPISSDSEAQVEITLLGTTPSPDKTSLLITISIHNSGTLPFTLSESDMLLTQSDGTLLALKSSNPSLPKDLQPGGTETFELSFDRLSSATATLSVLTVEYEIEGYQ